MTGSPRIRHASQVCDLQVPRQGRRAGRRRSPEGGRPGPGRAAARRGTSPRQVGHVHLVRGGGHTGCVTKNLTPRIVKTF